MPEPVATAPDHAPEIEASTAPPDPKNETAAPGVGARHGGNQEARKSLRQPKYHDRQRARKLQLEIEELEDLLRSEQHAIHQQRQVEQACAGDKRFFARRLDRSHRVRIARLAEIEEMRMSRLPGHLRWFVVVHQVMPGVRMRLMFPCLRDAETDLSEAHCAAIFAFVKGGYCVEIEELEDLLRSELGALILSAAQAGGPNQDDATGEVRS